MIRPLTFAIGLLAAPAMAESHDVSKADMATVGNLHLSQPVLRATPPAAPAGAGYVVIENRGDTDDTLISASIAGGVAGMVQLHEMAMDGDVMRMREVEGGIVIPAGESVSLMPGGLHIMLMDLQTPLEVGAEHEVTLSFEEAGEVTLTMPVADLGAIREIFGEPGMSHGEGGMTHGGDSSGHGN
ncbi:copper chaperone PCu(A)C [Jannaschia aquimarina]|uniref:Copper chaperone PCu(A)C n=1 Tax=Jannaschia aquimarina TaxID=935700 RepID=A0A0D1CN07_9RHOB|nr:copper chaperone PCu(A)C [Jannaschia aquimarina]KIT16162.1 hypothetical protein jaqu_21240 [Jannaschia aquimarina]SNT36926.1 hypothetical protein SAMN05421775_11319 [Jannaschia aquimarina]